MLRKAGDRYGTAFALSLLEFSSLDAPAAAAAAARTNSALRRVKPAEMLERRR
jgi:hypothetical protein